MKKFLCVVLLMLVSSPLLAQRILHYVCDAGNPTDPNDTHVAFTLQLAPGLEELRAGDQIVIRNHNALN
jgi:hypothetical protein